ncbi:hypothetical protein [Paracoccus bogoriensis]|uniref:hypothetical protein n=1 Tax=Paracoccus bogoriensis TaxID=242065 RepID=UPI0031BA8335
MTTLTDTQTTILFLAAQRADRNVLPLPGYLRGGAAAKVASALLSQGLISETTTESRMRADTAINRIWRNDEDGRAILLHITDAGLAAICIKSENTTRGRRTSPHRAHSAPSARERSRLR